MSYPADAVRGVVDAGTGLAAETSNASATATGNEELT
jgi:hypothetical protein